MDWGKELKCKGHGIGKTAGCGALLLVSPRDITTTRSSDYGGGSDTTYSFTCPECGACTEVSYNTFYRS